MTTIRNNPLEVFLLLFYLAIMVKSIVIGDWPRVLHWTGAGLIMTGVLMGMSR